MNRKEMEEIYVKAWQQMKHGWVSLRDLQPHPIIQRKFRPPWARFLRDTFNPGKCEELACVPRDGHWLVWDGQHRLWAAREWLGDEDQKLKCQLFPDIPVEVLAEMFLGRSSNLAMRAFDKWTIRAVAKDPTVLAIQGMLDHHHLRVGEAFTPGTIRAVAALEEVYSAYGGEVSLERCVVILKAAWGNDAEAFDRNLLRGLGMFVHRFNGRVNDRELIKKLQTSSGPGLLLGQARDLSKSMSCSVARATAEKLIAVYNRRRQGKRLKWDDPSDGKKA